jgi:magnesium chelatase subunit I
MDHITIHTLGALKASNYKSLSVKDELRKNLIKQLKNKEEGFEGILGYDETVIPESYLVTIFCF